MVTLNRIYTRVGDSGDTALGSQERVYKNHPRIKAGGSVDELNAALGLAIIHMQAEPGLADMSRQIKRIQNDLFDLGADLTNTVDEDSRGRQTLQIQQSQVERIEREIDAANAKLQPLKSFILPGGSAPAASLHIARTLCRKAEREIIELWLQKNGLQKNGLQKNEKVRMPLRKYINRLSDLLFVLARTANQIMGKDDILWVPAANRK